MSDAVLSQDISGISEYVMAVVFTFNDHFKPWVWNLIPDAPPPIWDIRDQILGVSTYLHICLIVRPLTHVKDYNGQYTFSQFACWSHLTGFLLLLFHNVFLLFTLPSIPQAWGLPTCPWPTPRSDTLGRTFKCSLQSVDHHSQAQGQETGGLCLRTKRERRISSRYILDGRGHILQSWFGTW